MIEYEKQVNTIYEDQRRLGFAVRMDVLFGWTQEEPNQWAACKDLLNPEWEYPLKNRREVITFLNQNGREVIKINRPEELKVDEYSNGGG